MSDIDTNTDTSTDTKAAAHELVDAAAAIAAADAAKTLADYLAWKRPDLEESIISIRGLRTAIMNSVTDVLDPLTNASFRHAVCLLDANFRHYRRTRATEELAAELLAEYGEARGGSPVDWETRQEDYSNKTYYMMSFMGGPTDPTRETRLRDRPCAGRETLEGREEQYVVPEVAEVADAK